MRISHGWATWHESEESLCACNLHSLPYVYPVMQSFKILSLRLFVTVVTVSRSFGRFRDCPLPGGRGPGVKLRVRGGEGRCSERISDRIPGNSQTHMDETGSNKRISGEKRSS